MFERRPTQTCKSHSRVGKTGYPFQPRCPATSTQPPTHTHSWHRAFIRRTPKETQPRPASVAVKRSSPIPKMVALRTLTFTLKMLIRFNFTATGSFCVACSVVWFVSTLRRRRHGPIMRVRCARQVKVKMIGERRKADGYRGAIFWIQSHRIFPPQRGCHLGRQRACVSLLVVEGGVSEDIFKEPHCCILPHKCLRSAGTISDPVVMHADPCSYNMQRVFASHVWAFCSFFFSLTPKYFTTGN